MEIISSDIPHIANYAEYIQYWKHVYSALYKDKKLLITNINVVEQHLALNFDKIRHIMDEDLFEWNHAMIVTLILAVHYDRIEKKQMPQNFYKQYTLLQDKKNTFCNALLNLTLIHDRWNHFNLMDYFIIKQYIRNVHKDILYHFTYANSIEIVNRWNFAKIIGKNLYKPNNKAFMLSTCRIATQLQMLLLAEKVFPYRELKNVYTFSDVTMNIFFNWCCNQTTYFTIRNFRNRILNFFWLFMNDSATRCFYTYNRVGEIPSIHSHVTGKYPQQWTSAIQHMILYGEPKELLTHVTNKIKDATLIALWEAHIKTIYSFNFSKYCLCMGTNIISEIKHIVLAKHPVVLRIWHKWYLMVSGKLFKYETLPETLLAWLYHLKDEHDSCLLNGQINLLKLTHELCVTKKIEEKDYSQEAFIEVLS